LVAIASSGISAVIGYRSAREALEQQSFDKLTAVREMKASQIEDYFQQIMDQVVTLSESQMMIQAALAFRSALNELPTSLALTAEVREANDLQLRLHYQERFLSRLNKNLPSEASLQDYWPEDEKTRTLQHLYIVSNPFETGSKHLLDGSEDPSTYTRTHRLYHPLIRSFLERFGFYDIFIVDPEDGHIVYSVFKETDFGTSLLSGPYSDTNFAEAFRAAQQSSTKDFVRLVDFAPYAPSYGSEASFIASPIFQGEDKVGILVFQMPVDRINDIMTNRQDWAGVGLGASGESYIVGDDYTLRTQSRFLIEDKEDYLRAIETAGTPKETVSRISNLNSSIGLQEVRTKGTLAALKGDTGTQIFPDYRDVPVLSSYKPLNILDMSWVIMSEIDQDEAFQSARDLRNRVLTSQLLLFLVILVVAIVFSRSLVQPLKDLSRTASKLAKGQMETEIDVGGHDEIGQLSRSFEAMRQSLKKLLERQARAIDALAVPLIPLSEGVVVIPLVGELDEHRISKFRAELIEGLNASDTHVAIIDITGVPEMDHHVAEGLTSVAQSARLLGAQVVLTGMQSEVAQSLADLDLQFDGVVTERSLRRGIDFAMKEMQRRESADREEDGSGQIW
jgi:anti-anti-sigma regulatory factor/HAMP domain-containing protein